MEVPVIIVGAFTALVVPFCKHVNVFFIRLKVSYFETDQVLEIDEDKEGRDDGSQEHFLEKDSSDGSFSKFVLYLEVLFDDIGPEFEKSSWIKTLAF